MIAPFQSTKSASIKKTPPDAVSTPVRNRVGEYVYRSSLPGNNGLVQRLTDFKGRKRLGLSPLWRVKPNCSKNPYFENLSFAYDALIMFLKDRQASEPESDDQSSWAYCHEVSTDSGTESPWESSVVAVIFALRGHGRCTNAGFREIFVGVHQILGQMSMIARRQMDASEGASGTSTLRLCI